MVPNQKTSNIAKMSITHLDCELEFKEGKHGNSTR